MGIDIMPNRFDNLDCMIGMAEYEDNHFDLAIVDPPYGLDDWNMRGSNKKLYDKEYMQLEKIQDWESNFDYTNYFLELFRISKNQIIWGGNHFLDYLGKTKQMIVWDKRIRGMHFNDCEIAWCSNIKEACRIFEHTANQLDRIHPTQKPIALYKWLLTKYAKQGDLILDTHVGSASSLIACEDMGFEYVGFEIDEDYYEAAQKRLTQFRSQLKLAI